VAGRRAAGICRRKSASRLLARNDAVEKLGSCSNSFGPNERRAVSGSAGRTVAKWRIMHGVRLAQMLGWAIGR
jgi:hypothetical protein